MTTGPNPTIEKARSIGSRAPRASRSDESSSSASRRSDALQFRQTLAREGGDGHDLRVLEKRTPREVARVGDGDLDELRRSTRSIFVTAIDAPADPEQPHDLEVLARLRHDRLVRRDDEEHGVDPSGAGQHVAHETLVARHVHEGEADALPFRVRETEVDRNAAPFLLREPVRVDPRQRLHQGRLAVVDVPGRPHEKTPHRKRLYPRRYVIARDLRPAGRTGERLGRMRPRPLA